MGLMKYSPSVPIEKVCDFITAVDALLNYWPNDETQYDLEDGYIMRAFRSGDERVALLLRGPDAQATWRENA